MEIILIGNNIEDAPEYLKEIWEQVKNEVDSYRGVEDSKGTLLSHNAYLEANIGHYTKLIELRAVNNSRLLATYKISPSLVPIGFVGWDGELVKLF